MEEKKEVKIYIKIENKEEIENWVHGLVEQLHEASLGFVKVSRKLVVDGKEIEESKTPLSFTAKSEYGEYKHSLNPEEIPGHTFDYKP